MKYIKRLLIVCVALQSLSIFAEDEVIKVSYREMLNLNRQNIILVKTGMDITSVTTIMKNYQSDVRDGLLNNPWKIERKGNMDVYHYLVNRNPPFTPILEQQAKPVIFVNGKVQSIGREYLRSARLQAISSIAPTTVQPTTVQLTTQPVTQSTTEDLGTRLKKLKTLYENGLIDKPTYELQQKRILDSI